MWGNSALIVLSGGQDSTTCLFWAKRNFDKVHAVTFDYGQKHSRELQSAKWVAKLAGVESHEIVEVGSILAGTSPLTNKAEKLEQYVDWKALPGGLEKTFVPGRNALFALLAANRAYCKNLNDMIMGICQEDFGGYPDCRESFRRSMESALYFALDREMRIHAPLMFLSKANSVKLAYTMPECFQALAFTHTAYDGAYPPAGHDHATLLRAKGFEQANLPDPLVVRAFDEGLMDLPTTANYDHIRHHDTLSWASSVSRVVLWNDMKRRLGIVDQLAMFGKEGTLAE